MDTVINHRQILTYIAAKLDVRFGSEAVLQYDNTRMTASGSKAALQVRVFRVKTTSLFREPLNVRFSPKRTFRSWKFADFEGPLSATSGHFPFGALLASLDSREY